MNVFEIMHISSMLINCKPKLESIVCQRIKEREVNRHPYHCPLTQCLYVLVNPPIGAFCIGICPFEDVKSQHNHTK